MLKIRLGDQVTFKANDIDDTHIIPITIEGQVRAIVQILDNLDDEHWQYLIRRKNGSELTVGEPAWKLVTNDG